MRRLTLLRTTTLFQPLDGEGASIRLILRAGVTSTVTGTPGSEP
jgi:hypothetical protein